MLFSEATEVPISQMAGRDYDTVQNAIKQGMNHGCFGSTFNNSTVVWHKWRLMGDCVEVLKEGNEKWKLIPVDDMTFRHKLGVYGHKSQTLIRFQFDFGTRKR